MFVLKLRKWHNHLKVTANVITLSVCVRVHCKCHLISLLLRCISSSHRYLSRFFFISPALDPYFPSTSAICCINPHRFPLSLHQRSAWLRSRSAAPSCRATFRAWCSVATNAPSHAPVTKPCSCTCRNMLRSSPINASSAIMTAVGEAS